MNFFEYMFGLNKKEETTVQEKTVCDEKEEKSVKDSLIEELEEKTETPEGKKIEKKEDIVSKYD